MAAELESITPELNKELDKILVVIPFIFNEFVKDRYKLHKRSLNIDEKVATNTTFRNDVIKKSKSLDNFFLDTTSLKNRHNRTGFGETFNIIGAVLSLLLHIPFYYEFELVSDEFKLVSDEVKTESIISYNDEFELVSDEVETESIISYNDDNINFFIQMFSAYNIYNKDMNEADKCEMLNDIEFTPEPKPKSESKCSISYKYLKYKKKYIQLKKLNKQLKNI